MHLRQCIKSRPGWQFLHVCRTGQIQRQTRHPLLFPLAGKWQPIHLILKIRKKREGNVQRVILFSISERCWVLRLNVRVCLFYYFFFVGLVPTVLSHLSVWLPDPVVLPYLFPLLKYWQTLEGVWWFSYHFCVCLSLIFVPPLHNKSSIEKVSDFSLSVWPTFFFLSVKSVRKIGNPGRGRYFRRLLDLWDLYRSRFTYRNDFLLRLECQINVGSTLNPFLSLQTRHHFVVETAHLWE